MFADAAAGGNTLNIGELSDRFTVISSLAWGAADFVCHLSCPLPLPPYCAGVLANPLPFVYLTALEQQTGSQLP